MSNEEQRVVYLDGTEKVVYVHAIIDPSSKIDPDFFRGTGRTKRQGLEIIHTAMARPEQYVPIIDHFGGSRANKMLTEFISTVIKVMDCPGLVLVRADRLGLASIPRNQREPILQQLAKENWSEMHFLVFDQEHDQRTKERRNRQFQQVQF